MVSFHTDWLKGFYLQFVGYINSKKHFKKTHTHNKNHISQKTYFTASHKTAFIDFMPKLMLCWTFHLSEKVTKTWQPKHGFNGQNKHQVVGVVTNLDVLNMY